MLSACVNQAGARPVLAPSQRFAEDLKSFRSPSPQAVKTGSTSWTFPNAAFDDVWSSVILIAIQHRFVASISKATGLLILAAPPTGSRPTDNVALVNSGGEFPNAVLVERIDDNVIVHVNWVAQYTPQGKGLEHPIAVISQQDRLVVAKSFFDHVSEQFYASTKWRWLSALPPGESSR